MISSGPKIKRVLITGANGFIGKNLQLHLAQRKDLNVLCFTRDNSENQLFNMLKEVDFIFHLAGANRPHNPTDILSDNFQFTELLCNSVGKLERDSNKKIPIIFTSSVQAELDNNYGQSKLAAENALLELEQRSGIPVYLFRLPNVFGKWCRPNYNSVVATFCHNIARGLPIQINDGAASLKLVYVDHVIERFVQLMDGADPTLDDMGFEYISPQFKTTIKALADQITDFKESRRNFITERVGAGLLRVLYSTYLSYLPCEEFAYNLPTYTDDRGVFAEFLKTTDSGQISYFTAYPGVTRGGHYHHTKTEKFLVIKGNARFKFRHMQTGEAYEILTSGDNAKVVETIPGWTHDITNIGEVEMVVLLWANEIFDRSKPDTYHCPL